MQSLPGFRDLYPEDHTQRRYLLHVWRTVARRYGFREYDGPTLESTALYEKKNAQNGGAEILGQLYRFTDKGERDVALRPEMTPTLARMVMAREAHYRKPIKWFSIANFFRFERQQKGRLREFLQLNCDIFGDATPASDAELIALTIDVLREFGLTEDDFVLRLSDRRAWLSFLEQHGLPVERAPEFLAIVDKMERDTPERTAEALSSFGLTLETVRDFIAHGGEEAFAPLLADLRARGLGGFVEADLTIVRGLAYYTGVVFEIFDRQREFRAIAGGGRYDHLLRDLSDGSVDLPAIGMGMGDVVLGKFLETRPAAAARAAAFAAAETACEIYLVIAAEENRPAALGLLTELRAAGWRVDYPLGPAKVGKQFAAAEAAGAQFAVVIGSEWPQIKLKTLATREEIELPRDQLLPHLGLPKR
jgi:histidyl-tRNA synthetase